MKLIIRSCVFAAVIWTAGFGVASAVTSYQGDDFSFDYFSRTYMAACDQESDGNQVKGNYDFDNSGGTDGSAMDEDGNNGVCGTANTFGTVIRHRTCEVQQFWPDNCGNWQATA